MQNVLIVHTWIEVMTMIPPMSWVGMTDALWIHISGLVLIFAFLAWTWRPEPS